MTEIEIGIATEAVIGTGATAIEPAGLAAGWIGWIAVLAIAVRPPHGRDSPGGSHPGHRSRSTHRTPAERPGRNLETYLVTRDELRLCVLAYLSTPRSYRR